MMDGSVPAHGLSGGPLGAGVAPAGGALSADQSSPEQLAAASKLKAALATALLPILPAMVGKAGVGKTGGVWLKAGPSPILRRYLHEIAAVFGLRALPKIPTNFDRETLFGGVDWSASLASGRPVQTPGIAARAAGLPLLLPMAEQMTPAQGALLAEMLDADRPPFLIAIDEAGEDSSGDTDLPAALADRLGIILSLEGICATDAEITSAEPLASASGISGEESLQALGELAAALGVASLRCLRAAAGVADALARAAGRSQPSEQDFQSAAALTLIPRSSSNSEPDPAPPPEPEEEQNQAQDGQAEKPPDPSTGQEQSAGDVTPESQRITLPADLLALLGGMAARTSARASSGRGAGKARIARRGRPVGVRGGMLRAGDRLDIAATIRAAIPWQGLRGRRPDQPLQIRSDDFRIKRFQEVKRRCSIFAVDASGSSAFGRMAEAKGAVELLLAECYIRRDRVSLIAFRGKRADIVLPPTSSLARGKRALAAMPGGGGTPLAAALLAASALADQVQRSGEAPLIVLLTDGGANITLEGTGGRAQAVAEAEQAARAICYQGIPSLVVDTSTRTSGRSRRLAQSLGADYLALPGGNASGIAAAVGGMHARSSGRKKGA